MLCCLSLSRFSFVVPAITTCFCPSLTSGLASKGVLRCGVVYLTSAVLRRMDTLPVLEMVAEEVLWEWDMWRKISGVRTMAAGFSHVSVRAARLIMHCYWKGRGRPASDAPPPEKAIVRILHQAPPTMRTCSLGSASPVRSAARSWDLQASTKYERPATVEEVSCNPYAPCVRERTNCFYQSAA
jgi:hypothetical protein